MLVNGPGFALPNRGASSSPESRSEATQQGRSPLPDELFQAPANRFVAGFMGSPGMNFATVELRGDDEHTTVVLAGHEFEVPSALRRRPGLVRYLGCHMVMGLRPVASAVAPEPRPGTLLIVPWASSRSATRSTCCSALPAKDPDERDTQDVPVAADEAAAAALWLRREGDDVVQIAARRGRGGVRTGAVAEAHDQIGLPEPGEQVADQLPRPLELDGVAQW